MIGVSEISSSVSEGRCLLNPFKESSEIFAPLTSSAINDELRSKQKPASVRAVFESTRERRRGRSVGGYLLIVCLEKIVTDMQSRKRYWWHLSGEKL